MSEEKQILARAKRGELAAFEELVALHEKRVYTMAYRSTGSAEDAADLTQETFLRAWRAMNSFRGDSGFGTWLLRITMNLCVDLARKKSTQPPTQSLTTPDGEGEFSLPDSAPTPEEMLENTETGREIAEALDELSEEHRRIVLLRDVSGLSYSAIAEALEISEGTVKSRLARARISLRTILLRRGNISLPSASNPSKGGAEA